MRLSELCAKYVCLGTLLWSGLLFSSLCDDEPPGLTTSELLVLGPPHTSTTVTLTSTITVTTTLDHAPSLTPGNSQYGLVGCYSQPSKDGGNIFGTDESNVSSSHTIDDCLRSCGSKAPSNKGTGHYMYAGLRNGSECLCGVQLSTDARKLSASDCISGGKDNVAVYSLIPTTSTRKPTSPTKKPTTTRPSASSFTIDNSSGSKEPKKLGTGPTVAAVVGSLSGAILLAAGLFICYRTYKRKKRDQDAHVKSVLDRRGLQSVPNPISTSANIHNNITNLVTPVHKRNASKDTGDSSGTDDRDRFTADRDFIPTTPGLEAGGKSPGLHARRASAAVSNGSEQRDNTRGARMGEQRSGPVNPRTHSPAAGASSAVQWRPGNTAGSVPLSPSAAREQAKSSSNIATPPPAANTAGLGERAWHRRKLSTPFPPPVGARPGMSGGPGIPAGAANNARSYLQRPLPPPPPPPKPGVRAIPQPTAQPGPGAMPSEPGSTAGPSENRPPARPRRSFDTIVFEPAIWDDDELHLMPVPVSKGAALGMSHANVNMSTPSLGRYGSISKRRQSNLESPVLGWQAHEWGGPSRERKREDRLVNRQPTIPVLPPVAPGERFDHKQWGGTAYAPLPEADKKGKQPQRRSVQEDLASPVSVSSVGTSILFTPEEFDRRL
ncbi:hypothetical protein GGR51DRAFT_181844 [Nemania sp. FL0031]|nr:hypothetical protein GGR51DRAFT_181844 [Nemania sp. FL0031]